MFEISPAVRFYSGNRFLDKSNVIFGIAEAYRLFNTYRNFYVTIFSTQLLTNWEEKQMKSHL